MPHAIVVGAGIGGLAAGVALRRAGWDVNVLERADAPREAGAALLMAPNAMHALDALGLAAAARAAGVAPRWGEIRTPAGRVLKRVDNRRVEAALGHPNVALLRPRLHALLLHALGADRLRAGARVVELGQDDARAWVRTADGREAGADLVVGADGIGSVVRECLHGRSPPRAAGFTAWRGVGPLPPRLLPPDTGALYMGRGGEAGVAPLENDQAYWYVTAPTRGSTDADAKRDLLARMPRYHEPFRALVEATPAQNVRRDDIVDRDPLPSWGEGRVTLLGDAAHPMTPNAGQGAAQAIEDAVVLARAVAASPNEIPAALQRYEGARIPRTSEIVRLSRRNGRMGLMEHPLACGLRDLAVRALPAGAVIRQLVAAARPALTARA